MIMWNVERIVISTSLSSALPLLCLTFQTSGAASDLVDQHQDNGRQSRSVALLHWHIAAPMRKVHGWTAELWNAHIQSICQRFSGHLTTYVSTLELLFGQVMDV
ncbi:hypothetical protein BC832DRAFT_558512 [Gaertneriomyces semiglobifer]|nr:hypothetical protein BC832DRAFT_558512 [Gaertneriomyces semiglobifer]